MEKGYLFKTRLPTCYYVWIGLNIILSLVFISYNNIFYALILEFIFAFFSYLMIARYTCEVILYNDKIIAKYPFQLFKETTINFQKNDFVTYELGYYFYFNSEHNIAKQQFINPQDEINFYKTMAKSSYYGTIKINTNYKDFKQIQEQLSKLVIATPSYDVK